MSDSPELNAGLEANAIVSPDNAHTEPIPRFVSNEVPVEEPAEEVKVKVKKSKK